MSSKLPHNDSPRVNGDAERAETWTERAEATLAAAGHRRGGARRALLELLDRQECALTAQEIEDALRARGARDGGGRSGGGGGGGDRRGRRVSRASVYRILEELSGCGWCSAWRPARRWSATSACASTQSTTITISCATSAAW